MSKYEIGQAIPVGGIITITGLAHNKNGNPVYNTDRGVVVPELLIERLEMKPLEKAQPEQPKQEDKSKFKVGQKYKVRSSLDWDGDVIEITSISGGEINYKIIKTCGSNHLVLNFDSDSLFAKSLEPYTEPYTEPESTEPKQEPVKLYCVKDYEPGAYLTHGKVYEYVPGEGFPYDDDTGCPEKDYATWASFNPTFSACLVPLVSRPAKVGEWICITKSGDPRANEGSIYEVAPYDLSGGLFVRHPGGNRFSDGAANISPSEYLVLDGYKPEPEKAEPEYYSGKVVCVEATDRGVTLGKVYTVEKGVFTWNDGKKFDTKATTIEQFNHLFIAAKFIEFKGE